MDKERKYKLIHLAYVLVTFTVLGTGFALEFPPLVIAGLVAGAVYPGIIGRWREKHGIIRKDERTVKEIKEVTYVSFWIVFFGACGFYIATWILKSYRLISPGLSEIGETTAYFGAFMFAVFLAVMLSYGIKNWLRKKSLQ